MHFWFSKSTPSYVTVIYSQVNKCSVNEKYFGLWGLCKNFVVYGSKKPTFQDNMYLTESSKCQLEGIFGNHLV